MSVCWAKSTPRKARGQVRRERRSRGRQTAAEEAEVAEGETELGRGGGTSEGSELLIM